MSKFKVISRDATSVRYEGAPQYSGTYLGVDYVEFKNISSPNVIDWQIGDYVDYFRTGIRYKLYTLPMPKKVARVGSYGGAIVYDNVQFFAPTKDLEIAPFRDLVLNENGIHFSTRQDVSTYEDVRGIARRIQACMDDLFPNRWRIEVYETDDEELNNQLAEVKEFSVSQSTCLDALSQIYDTWKGVGWVHFTDNENNQEVIVIGRANVRDADNTTDLFTYGIGNGLTSIRKNSANEGEFATRLYVYGSERNLQPRYYNQFDIVNKESVDIRNLMIPISEWGLTDGVPDAKKAYLQADDALIEKYGLIPKTLYFDGTEGEEIYPSIVGITEGKVREYMIKDGLEDSPLLPPDTNDRIDKALWIEFTDDKGAEEDIKANPNFSFWVRGVGFDIAEQGKKTSEGHATISMKSGMCAGRNFVVKKSRMVGYSQELTLERAWDESLGMGFPNNIYPIEAGEEFVLLDIPMPDYYISIAEDRLLEQGKKMLADYTRVSAFYEPEVNAIRMKEVGGVITPGMYMKVKDDDIIETEDHIDYVLIDSLSIDEITEIPTYKITLRDEKRAARTYSALEDMIEDAKENANQAIKRERQYTDRRFKSAQETLSMLEGAFSSFSKGITPATVKTMALLIGDESLQYKFTASRDSLVDVPCPLSWNPETKQMIGVYAALVHMTLEVYSITIPDARRVSDYMRWNVVSWWDKDSYQSPFLEDASKSYYIYVKASMESTDAWYFLDETYHPMIEGDYYYFLVGVLNSEYEGSRDFVTLYGFTEVLPGQITTDVIKSGDGNTYFDLQEGVISGDIRFIADGEEKQVSEYAKETDFLKTTFKKGETNISGGVVMTEMVAVGEGGDEIEAFLNGSDYAEDTENGKLILAAGIPKGDADKLKERSAEATTRIYERGKIVTNNIEANGGKFKDVEVLGSSRSPFVEGAWIDGVTNYLEDNHYSFSTSGGTYFPLSKDISESGRVITLVGSFAIYGSKECRIYDRGKLYQNEYLYTGYASDLLSKNNKTDFGFELVRLMAVPYSTTEVAWEVIERRPLRDNSYSSAYLTGVIGGLRPKTRAIVDNTTLTTLDHSIMISSSTSLNINLPSNAEAGQTIEFYLPYSSSTTLKHRIQGNGLGIQCPHNDTWNNSYFDILAYGVVKFICIADANGDLHWWFYRIA